MLLCFHSNQNAGGQLAGIHACMANVSWTLGMQNACRRTPPFLLSYLGGGPYRNRIKCPFELAIPGLTHATE